MSEVLELLRYDEHRNVIRPLRLSRKAVLMGICWYKARKVRHLTRNTVCGLNGPPENWQIQAKDLLVVTHELKTQPQTVLKLTQVHKQKMLR